MTDQGDTEQIQRCKRRRRPLVLALGGVLCLLIVLVLLLPILISTGPGLWVALRILNGRIPGTVSIQDLSIGWFSGQTVDQLNVLDPQGATVLSVRSLRLPDASLWSVFRGGLDLGQLHGEHLGLNLIEYKDGSTNLGRTFSTAAGRIDPDSKGFREGKSVKWGQSKAELFRFPKDLSVACVLTDLTVTYTVANQLPVVLRSKKVWFDGLDPTHQEIEFEAYIDHDELSSPCRIQARLDHLFSADGVLQLDKAELEASVVVTDLPVAALDQVLGQGGVLAELLGPSLTTNFKAHGRINQIEAAIEVRCAHLKADTQLTIGPSGLLGQSSRLLNWTITPEAWRLLTATDQANASELLEQVDVQIDLVQLKAPLKGGRIGWFDAGLALHLLVDDVHLDIDQIGRVDLTKIKGSATTNRLGERIEARFSTAAKLKGQLGEIGVEALVLDLINPENEINHGNFSAQIRGQMANAPIAVALDAMFSPWAKGLLAEAIGSTADIRLEVDLDSSSAGSPVSRFVRLEFESLYLDATLSGRVSAQRIELDRSSHIDFQLRPQWIGRLQANGDRPQSHQGLALAEPAHLNLGIEHLVAPLTGFRIDAVSASIAARFDRLVLTGNEGFQNLELQNVKIELPQASLGEELSVSVSAELPHTQFIGTLQSESVFHLIQEQGFRLVRSQTTIKDLHTDLIKGWLNQTGKFVDLLGQSIDQLSVVMEGDPRVINPEQIKIAAFAVQVDSAVVQSNLEGTLAIESDQSRITLNDQSFAEFQLTPDLFDRYFKRSDPAIDYERVQLCLPTTMRLEVSDFQVVQPDPGPIRVSLVADLSNSQAEFRYQQQNIHVRGIKVKLKAYSDPSHSSSLYMEADFQKDQGDSVLQHVGRFNSVTTIVGLFNEAGRLDLLGSTLRTDTKAEQLSVAMIEVLLGQEGAVQSLIGPLVDLHVRGAFPGDLNLSLEGETGHLRVPLRINLSRGVTLREDMEAQIKVTSTAARTWLGPVQPMLADVVSSEEPVRLVIHKDRFKLPLKAFDVTNIKLDGTLDLGALYMNRRGWVMQGIQGVFDQLMSGLGLLRPAPQVDSESYLATFTPMTFRVRNGRVRSSELWMTSPDLALGMQGSINLVNRQMNMTMGLLGASLIAGLGTDRISDRVDPNQIYEIPFTGPLESPKADYVPIVKQIVVFNFKREMGIDLEGILGKEKSPKDALQWNPPDAVSQLLESVGSPQETRYQQGSGGQTTGSGTEVEVLKSGKKQLVPGGRLERQKRRQQREREREKRRRRKLGNE